MVDADLVTAKLADLADRIERVRAHARNDAVELSNDRDALDLVSFNLMLSVQICADIASHIIADEGYAPANNLAQGFARLAENGVIESGVASRLQKAVGLRNVVAHGYSRIDTSMVHSAATDGLRDLSAFAREVATWLAAQSS